MHSDVIRFEEEAERLRISWDNRKIRKDTSQLRFFLLFWVGWAPATISATVMIFTSDSPAFYTAWSIFGWIGTIAIPLWLAQTLCVEWIEIDSQAISWGARGPCAGKERRLPLCEVAEFGLGRNSDRYEYESSFSLNVYESPGRLGTMKRHMLAIWLAKEHKEEIFDRVREFVEKRSIPLKVTTYGV